MAKELLEHCGQRQEVRKFLGEHSFPTLKANAGHWTNGIKCVCNSVSNSPSKVE